MKDIRHTSIVGVYEDDDDFPSYSIHFSEWWNGEGLDFELTSGERVSLHDTELSALVTIAIATGFVDIDSCIQNAKELNQESEKRLDLLTSIRDTPTNNMMAQDISEPGQFKCGGILYWSDPTGQFPTEIFDKTENMFRMMTNDERKVLDKCRYPRDYPNKD